jgi:hypothetical protein
LSTFRAALGPNDRAHGIPTELVVTVKLEADSEDAARMKDAELVQDALDQASLYGYFQTQDLYATKLHWFVT